MIREIADRDYGQACSALPNDPSSATRPTRAFACNLDAMAGLDAMMG